MSLRGRLSTEEISRDTSSLPIIPMIFIHLIKLLCCKKQILRSRNAQHFTYFGIINRCELFDGNPGLLRFARNDNVKRANSKVG